MPRTSSKADTKFSEGYIVERRRDDQTEAEWLQEQFSRNYTYLRDQVSTLSAGFGQFYSFTREDLANVSGIEYRLDVHDIHRITYVTIVFEAWDQPTDPVTEVDIYLPNARKYDNKDGDMIEVFLAGPSSNKLTFTFRNEDGSAITSVLAEKTSPSRIRVTFTSLEEVWYI